MTHSCPEHGDIENNNHVNHPGTCPKCGRNLVHDFDEAEDALEAGKSMSSRYGSIVSKARRGGQ